MAMLRQPRPRLSAEVSCRLASFIGNSRRVRCFVVPADYTCWASGSLSTGTAAGTRGGSRPRAVCRAILCFGHRQYQLQPPSVRHGHFLLDRVVLLAAGHEVGTAPQAALVGSVPKRAVGGGRPAAAEDLRVRRQGRMPASRTSFTTSRSAAGCPRHAKVTVVTTLCRALSRRSARLTCIRCQQPPGLRTAPAVNQPRLPHQHRRTPGTLWKFVAFGRIAASM